MSLEKNILLSKLFDIYSPLLSKNQVDIMNDYINNDITLTEIAENRNITRQAVKDVVGKVEKKLLIYEEKLGFNKKLESLKKDKSRKED